MGDDLVNEIQPMQAGRRMLWTAQYSQKIKFAATRTCQDRVDREWNSGIKSNYFVIILTYFCPFLLAWDSIQSWGTSDEGQIEEMTLLERIPIFYRSAQAKHMIMFVSSSVYCEFTYLFDDVGIYGSLKKANRMPLTAFCKPSDSA